ncbi:MAG TPA: Cys-tRNA(Pro) deacylase, partial [Phaeodactylibacter sp.]|nr:Cys-tRNA(Pro) deacylase [Phaeodactylibacter sp.]
MKKTNAIRLLAQKQITHRLLPYTYDADHLDVSTIAQAMGLPVALLYKTLVAKGDKTGVIVALVPGDKQLDYKALAKISGNKKVALVQVKDLLKLTGYIRG